VAASLLAAVAALVLLFPSATPATVALRAAAGGVLLSVTGANRRRKGTRPRRELDQIAAALAAIKIPSSAAARPARIDASAKSETAAAPEAAASAYE
jgi:hypothetical protein